MNEIIFNDIFLHLLAASKFHRKNFFVRVKTIICNFSLIRHHLASLTSLILVWMATEDYLTVAARARSLGFEILQGTKLKEGAKFVLPTLLTPKTWKLLDLIQELFFILRWQISRVTDNKSSSKLSK